MLFVFARGDSGCRPRYGLHGQEQSQLSPGCRVYFRSGPEPDVTRLSGSADEHQAGNRAKAGQRKARKSKKPKPDAT